MRLDEIFRLDERHQDIVAALSKYKDRDDIFISYRDIPKLGIYPQSTYDTPLGIYCYPIKQMWEFIETHNVPFAGNHPYVVVIKEVKPVPDLSDAIPYSYSESMLERDLEIIKTKFLPAFTKWFKEWNADHTWGNQRQYIDRILELLMDDPDGAKWFKNSKKAEKIMSAKSAYSSLENWDWEETLDEAGFSQDTIDDISALVAEFINGKNPDEHTVREDLNKRIESWIEEAVEWSQDNDNKNTPGSKFWNVTRKLAQLIGVGRKKSVVWTAVMRSMGYEGFTDLTGTGLIHGNEPTQAVFFSTKAIRLVEILPNVRKTKAPDQKETHDNAIVSMINKHKNRNKVVPLLRKLLDDPNTSSKMIDDVLKAIWFTHNDQDMFDKIKPYVPELYKRASDNVRQQTFWHTLDPDEFGPDPDPISW